MKNALVDIRQPVYIVTGWTPTGPTMAEIPASARIAQVEVEPFPVGDPLFWTACADEVVADQWYFDLVSQTAVVVPPPAPRTPAADQPVVTGAQTL